MKIGIVGLPNVGKSTLFNALTKSYAADSGNFPFCTIDANVGVVDVKDDRVDKLGEMFNSKDIIYSNIEFVDIAGLVKGASEGEGLGNQFLANIREVDAIVQVVRKFSDSNVNHVDGNIDPERDIETINTELIISDLQQVQSKKQSIQKKVRAGEKQAKEEDELLSKLEEVLKNGNQAYSIYDTLSKEDIKYIKQLNLLTFKPMIYAFNVLESDLCDWKNIKDNYEKKLDAPIVVVSAKIESEMIDLDEEEKNEFLNDIKNSCEEEVQIPTLDDLIKLAFDKVGLMYFFTAGEKEARAWTVKKGSTAPQAAGVIHSDFERGFIKAEVVKYDDLINHGNWTKAKENGLIKLQGKDYIVEDGDVILFRFNV